MGKLRIAILTVCCIFWLSFPSFAATKKAEPTVHYWFVHFTWHGQKSNGDGNTCVGTRTKYFDVKGVTASVKGTLKPGNPPDTVESVVVTNFISISKDAFDICRK